MFLLRCCGLGGDRVEVNAPCENQSLPVDEQPVVIEPLPDVSTLQLTHPSTLPEKGVAPSAPRNWRIFEDIPSNAKEVNVVSSINAITEHRNEPDEQVDMRSALDKRISNREYILSITDEELAHLPVAFIESFYPDLSPSEIMELEQRLCDLKTRITSERNVEQISVESENFLKSYHPLITIRTDTGFQVDKKRSNQNGLDIRQLILAARNQKIGPLDSEVLKQLQPFLSVIEFQDISEKMGSHTAQQKQQTDLPLIDHKKESSAASSYVYNAPTLNRDIYHLTTEPSFSADESVCSDDNVENNANKNIPPVIKITDFELENDIARELSNSPNEKVVKSLVDDILLKL